MDSQLTMAIITFSNFFEYVGGDFDGGMAAYRLLPSLIILLQICAEIAPRLVVLTAL